MCVCVCVYMCVCVCVCAESDPVNGASQSMVHRPAASTLCGRMLGMQNR